MALERRRYKNRFHKQKLVDIICQELRLLDRSLTSKEIADHINKEKLFTETVSPAMVEYEAKIARESLKFNNDKGRVVISAHTKSAVGND